MRLFIGSFVCSLLILVGVLGASQPVAAAQEEAAARTLPVHVRVRAGGMESSPVVPQAPVEIRAGWMPISTFGKPVAAAAQRILGEDMSDEHGDVRFEVALPALESPPKGFRWVLFAHADIPGRRLGVSQPAKLDQVDDPVIELFLAIPEGGVTVAGLLLDDESDPVAGGLVVFHRDDPSNQLGHATTKTAYTNVEGRFELDLGDGGAWDVHARALGRGAVGMRGIEIDPEDPPRDFELHLEGDGVLAGRVVHPDGSPVPRLRLWAVPESHPDAYVGYFNRLERAKYEWQGGLFDSHAVADDDGYFRFEGMRSGAYFIRSTQPGNGYYATLLTPSPVPTGSEDLLLRSEDQGLVISVRDSGGDIVEPRGWGRPGWSSPDGLWVFVHESNGEGTVLERDDPIDGQYDLLEDGRYRFQVRGNKHYVVGVMSDVHGLVEREVWVDGSSWSHQEEFVLGPESGAGMLVVDVLDPDGVAMKGHTRVRIDAPSGRTLFEPQRGLGNRHELTLPAGRYSCLVSAPPMPGTCGPIGRDRHLPVALEVEVIAGEETSVAVRLGREGRVRMHVALDDDAPREGHWPMVGVRLEPTDGGATVWPKFRGPSDMPVLSLAETYRSQVLPGEAQTSRDPIPPGRYRALFTRRGYESAVVDVEVVAGETAEVNAVLSRSPSGR